MERMNVISCGHVVMISWNFDISFDVFRIMLYL